MSSESKKYQYTCGKTDSDFIAEGWRVERLGVLVDIISGGTPSTYVKEYWNGDINWLVPTEIGEKKYILRSRKKITEAGLKNSSANLLPINSIILTSRAGIGDLAILGVGACANQGIQSLVPKSEIDGEYLYYLMFTKKSDLLSKASGSTFLEISPNSIRSILVCIPRKCEQIAIAAVLSDIDKLIEKQEQLITKKRAIKQGAMQQLLTGKKRLSGFSGEWGIEEVGDFGLVVTGGTPPTKNKEYWNGDIPWVTPTDIKFNKGIWKTEREITNLGLGVIRKLPKNSVLITCIASIGKNVILRKDGACNQQINAILPNAEHSSDFIYYLFENAKGYLLSKAGITATNIVSKQEFSKLTFSIPEKQEQIAIATVLSDIDVEVAVLEKSLKKYRQIKIGMMQQLLTGKIRLTRQRGGE